LDSLFQLLENLYLHCHRTYTLTLSFGEMPCQAA
jgi:hypothetical protein